MANPLYRQIAEDLRHQIDSGTLTPGSQLPTELELGDRYNASRNTIRDAIKWLINLGLVETRPGQGTFVIESIDPFVTTLSGPEGGFGGGEGASYLSEVSEANRKLSTSPVQVEIQWASDEIASSLWIPQGAEVITGTSGASSTTPRGRCRPPSTRRSSPTAVPGACGVLATSPREPSSTWRTHCTSARLATVTGSRCAPRTWARRPSSSSPPTAGSRCTRYFGPRSTGTGSRCA